MIAINLARNFGQHDALVDAMHYTDSDYVLDMDDGIQAHPSSTMTTFHLAEQRLRCDGWPLSPKNTPNLRNLSHKD